MLDMHEAHSHVPHMSKMIQVRNVPDDLHRELKARAARAGNTLSDYLLRELERAAARPTPAELRARLATRRPIEPVQSIADALRSEREARDRR